MSIPAFAVASALEASNVLVDKKESFTIKAIFKTDRFVTNALTALPAIALASLLIIKPSSFTTDIVTCTIRTKPEAHSLSGHLIHDNSQLADQNFINAYCNANLKNYTVDANGIVAPTKPMSYKFVKMFPFHLLTLIIIGGWTGLCWEITSKKRLSQAEYLFDGLEEAAGDLINALRSISHLLAAKTTKKLKKTSQSGGTLARMKANRNV
ncbi:Oidioi.mRNA.OKI2018_I69.chr1.g3223.t1.cds [Oikopleura dioica]|uniref:Oidioi.mRNA.OKI2018_I69.chr1.g3223.t1.cds n=1 Tax=Oikopleura dioica TaxID=34765 RepID=A0ABN7STH9_OIKDI|nr:Oidioi.mRNA.OKI2018_I69.chr1.g3223.t1.cds [Oikopleura dioica]